MIKQVWRSTKRLLLNPYLLIGLMLVLLTVFGTFVWGYASKVRGAFGRRNWSVPSRVYARPPELYPNKKTSMETIARKLGHRQYVKTDTATQSGQYSTGPSELTVALRSFRFLDGPVPARKIKITFRNNRIASLRELKSDTPDRLNIVRLEPLKIGTFFTHRYEDWVPLTYEETPELLRKTLLMIEDQRFYEHIGLDFQGITRAAIANIMAGEIVQGGSTLTQQLVKNRFLGNQQTLWRKFREAILALLTEWYFDKKTILQAYINEAYMGQLGKKSIQGFGKASRYYFGIPVGELTPDQIATLVGLIRGPSLYNPRRNRSLARKRRNFVLNRMREAGLITEKNYRNYRKQPLELAPKESISLTPYPDFLELVKQRLRRDFRSDELRQRGLRVYTTLIPETQRALQQTVKSKLPEINRRSANPASKLQTAIVASRVKTGEVTGLLGGRRIGYPGFNRALSPRRSVGSVIKPSIYLTALRQPEDYTLVSQLADTAFTMTPEGDTKPWSPKNYSKTLHDTVPMFEALTNSYNVATARLGLELGFDPVFETLRQLGIKKNLATHPSLFLGTSSLSPFQVTQMYQTLAGRGYHAPLKAVRGILTRTGTSLKRNPLELRRTLKTGPVYLVNHVLRRVTRVGTAQSLRNQLPQGLEVAGKTGTTQRYRDSWFAGFSRNRAITVWVGHDDNSPTGLTGASGALKLWGDIARRLNVKSLSTNPPPSVEMVPVDTTSWLPSKGRCENQIELPFIRGSQPDKLAPCARNDSFFF